MIELLPIVAKLAEKYTSKESSSITYERAEYLMEAVIYCINEYVDRIAGARSAEQSVLSFSATPSYDGENSRDSRLVSTEKLPPEQAYEIGSRILMEKVKAAREKYNNMIGSFCAYGNENYYETVTKGIPGFFKWYDIRFAPQNSIITMDYPVLMRMEKYSGIDAIEKYIECIRLEQKFMGAFPEEYVTGVLTDYLPDYSIHFFNICSIFLRHVIGSMLTEEQKTASADKLRRTLSASVDGLIKNKWNGDVRLAEYLKLDLADYVTELELAHGRPV